MRSGDECDKFHNLTFTSLENCSSGKRLSLDVVYDTCAGYGREKAQKQVSNLLNRDPCERKCCYYLNNVPHFLSTDVIVSLE